MALLQYLHTNREIVLSQTIQQVVSNAGDGSLRDGSRASEEFREFLTQIPIESLSGYVRQCLDTAFSHGGYALQDLVNELGRRLDFEVKNGLYRGKRNKIGFDGIWRFPGEPELVVEVKTTDAYTFALETTNEYREGLIVQNQVERNSSILIVVGREDTGALEAQVRGSRYAWDIRLIGVDRLIKLVEIRAKSDDPSTVKQIHHLLRPFEYTKVDRIVDILFATAIDVESQQDDQQIEATAEPVETSDQVQPIQDRTDRALIEIMKERAISAFGSFKAQSVVRRGRSYFWSADKSLRACCTVSKRYENAYQPYWYAYHPKWHEFLSEGKGFMIFACMDLDVAFAIPYAWFAENTQNLNSSERNGSLAYWHVPLTTMDDGSLAINLSKVGRKVSLAPFQFPLAKT
ncbi:MAG: hypothetical protein ABI972_12355 [Acidobacteriota bacterium]